MVMNKVLKIFAVILFVGFIGIQFMRPARTNPHFEKTESLKAITKVPNNVRQILVRCVRIAILMKPSIPGIQISHRFPGVLSIIYGLGAGNLTFQNGEGIQIVERPAN